MATPVARRGPFSLVRAKPNPAHTIRPRSQNRFFSPTRRFQSPSDGSLDIAKLLDQPTWSVQALLPQKLGQKQDAAGEDTPITPKLLRHLLRLSALPLPTSPEEQAAKIETLRAQLHFVREIQSVDTSGIRPLQAIRDESSAAMREQTIGIKDVEHALLQEESFGHNRRPRRRKNSTTTEETENFDVVGLARQTAGRYVVVDE